MKVALCLKFQSDLVITSERKRDERTKPRLIQSLLASSLFGSRWREGKQKMKNESITLACQQEINRHKKRERANTDIDIIILVFCCNSRIWFLGVLSSPLCIWAPTLPSPLCYPASTPTALSHEFLSANHGPTSDLCWHISIFNSDICCCFVLDLGNV